MRLLVTSVVTVALMGCSGEGEPEAGTPAQPAVLPVPSDAAVTRKTNEVDLDTVLAGLTGDVREQVQGLVNAARDKRREVAEWLGGAIEAERQAREYRAAGDEERAAGFLEQAASKRQTAKEILAEARADEARALELASAAANTGPVEQD